MLKKVEKKRCCSLLLTCLDKRYVGRFKVTTTGCWNDPGSTHICEGCLEYVLKTYQDTRFQHQRFNGYIAVVYKGWTDNGCQLCKRNGNIVGFYSDQCCNPSGEYCLDCIDSKLNDNIESKLNDNKRIQIRVFKSGNKRIVVKRFA